MLQLVILAVAAFASANLDDIFLLTAWLGDPKLRPWQVYAGQFLGFGVLAVASAVCAGFAIRISGHYLAFLGIAPVLLGLRRLWMVWKGGPGEQAPEHYAAKILAVATVTFVNGTDDFAVFVPLLARAGKLALPLMMIVFLVMTGLWCAIATVLASHRFVAAFLDRWGHRLMPVVLIGLGIYILSVGF
jgi:cadmium resistance protein CadD (predicted permease)